MTDHFTPEVRSRTMALIKNKNTKPEIIVRCIAHALGYRFRLHRSELAGSPDIVFSSKRKVIFVNGCFWHSHFGCKRATLPKSNTGFWRTKLAQNVERDTRSRAELVAAGWGILTIWECETKNRQDLEFIIDNFLRS